MVGLLGDGAIVEKHGNLTKLHCQAQDYVITIYSLYYVGVVLVFRQARFLKFLLTPQASQARTWAKR